MISIYKITHLETGKCYIGQAMDVQKRWQKHCHKSSGCKKLRNAIQKYGKYAFTFKVLFECEEEHANDLETSMILHYDGYTKGYNCTPYGGSNRGRKHSADTRRKMSDAAKNMSDETRQKISAANKGEKHPRSKLTNQERLEIVDLIKNSSYLQKEIAELYDISVSQISYIKRNSQ